MIEEDKVDVEEEYVSKSQIKREADSLVDLGKQLASLSIAQIEQVPLNEELHQAVLEAKRLSKGGAIKRQFKFIGKLLRDIETAPIQTALERVQAKDRGATARHHQLELWRDRLVQNGDKALSEFIEQYPAADRQHLRQLQRKAHQELQSEKPPAAARKIFQYLKDVVSFD